uniref:Protein BCCIP homolog n=1 Tax=Tetraselmis sp. GSL018 TaxID=582737 RepID=A0A061R7N2_9CHLO
MGKGKKRPGSLKNHLADDDKQNSIDKSQDSSDEISMDDEGEEEIPDDVEKINVDFEFFDPKEVDFHGLKALLGHYLDGEPFELSDFADAIIAQKTVGTVLKTGEDEDPIGVVTALNVGRYSGLKPLQQLFEYLKQKASEHGLADQYAKAWEAKGTALLVTERLINAPPELGPPLMQALFDEISWATEDEPTQELRDSFSLSRYLIFTRVYVDPSGPQDGAATSNARSKKLKPAGPTTVYIRPEDEFFQQQAEWSFSYRIESKQVGKDELQPWRLVMLVEAGAVPRALEGLNAAISGMASSGGGQL